MEPYNPFGSSVWLRHFVEQIVDDRTMSAVILEAKHDGSVSLMPLSFDPTRPWRWNGLNNYYSSLHTLLHTKSIDRPAVARELVRRLGQDQKGCSVLQISPLDANSVDSKAVRAALTEAGWYTKQYYCFGNWYLPCKGLAFADYMKARDSKLQNTWARKSKKFAAHGKGEARLHIATRPEEVAAAMDAFEAVYAKSWKTAEPYPAFVRGWASVCAQQGWLRLGTAWLGEVPIAVQFWFTVHERAYIFKLAYDEDYTKWSAGTVLTAHMFQHGLDVDRVIEIDYLTGDDEYKKSWMSHRRERIGLLACKLRSPRGLAMACREVGADLLRRWVPRASA